MAPDGRSFVTAVAVQNVSAWLHDPTGERQILLEGNTVDVRFTADGKKLFYKVVKQASSSWDHSEIPGELRRTDLATGRSEVVVPGFQALNYDVSVDGQQIVIEIADRDGSSRFWIAAFDGASPPRPIPGVEGKEPRFGRNGDIWFRRREGSSGLVYQVRPDGTGMQKVFEKPIFVFRGMSRDGRWIKAFTVPARNEGPSWQALPLDGGPSVPIAAYTGIGPPRGFGGHFGRPAARRPELCRSAPVGTVLTAGTAARSSFRAGSGGTAGRASHRR